VVNRKIAPTAIHGERRLADAPVLVAVANMAALYSAISTKPEWREKHQNQQVEAT